MDQIRTPFQTTRWTLVGDMASDDPAVRARAMEAIATVYWPAVYAAFRRLGRGRESAEEATQAFFADVVLGRCLLTRADPSRGRLRTLLHAAIRNYDTDQHRRAAARGQGRVVPLGDVDREERFLAAAPETSDESLFDRRFGLAVLEEALRRCERHYRASGKERNWTVFFSRVMAPQLSAGQARPLGELAAELGFATPADAAAAVQTVKKRLLALVREVAAESCGDEASEEDEYRRVMSLLGG